MLGRTAVEKMGIERVASSHPPIAADKLWRVPRKPLEQERFASLDNLPVVALRMKYCGSRAHRFDKDSQSMRDELSALALPWNGIGSVETARLEYRAESRNCPAVHPLLPDHTPVLQAARTAWQPRE